MCSVFNLRNEKLNSVSRFSDQLESNRIRNVLQRPAVDGDYPVAPFEAVRAFGMDLSGLEVLDVNSARRSGDLEPEPSLIVFDECDGDNLDPRLKNFFFFVTCQVAK
jgi:hypothetical protein